MNQLSAANVPEVPPSISEYTVQPAGSNSRTCPRPSRRLRFPAFYFSPSAPEIHTGVPDERGFVEAIFKAVRSCHKSRRYLRWNARQNISVNCYPVTSKSFAPFSETKSGLPLQGGGTLGASCAAYKGDEYNDASGSPVRSSFSLPMFFAFSISDSLT